MVQQTAAQGHRQSNRVNLEPLSWKDRSAVTLTRQSCDTYHRTIADERWEYIGVNPSSSSLMIHPICGS